MFKVLTKTLPTLESVWLQEPDGKYSHLNERIVEREWADDDLFGESGVERSWEYNDPDGQCIYTSARPLMPFAVFGSKFAKGYEIINDKAAALIEAAGDDLLYLCFNAQQGFYVELLREGDSLPIWISVGEIQTKGVEILSIKVKDRLDLKQWMKEEEAREAALEIERAEYFKKQKQLKREAEMPLEKFFEALSRLGYKPQYKSRRRGGALISYDVVGEMDGEKIRVSIQDWNVSTDLPKEIPFIQGDMSPDELAKLVYDEFQARVNPRLLSTGKPAPIKRRR